MYRQVRVGRHKRLFKVNKFRSMCVDAEPDGPALSRPGDPRITRLGRVLRKSTPSDTFSIYSKS